MLLRTDFSDDAAWQRLCDVASGLGGPAPEDAAFCASLECISESTLHDLMPEELVGLVPSPPPYFVFLADSLTFGHPEHPILAVDLNREPGRTVRVVPPSMWSIENNLSLGNMDFSDFADTADSIPDRIYRGF
ncbi:hypothetical protein FK531_02835 [Rhodococcus spelaei]|uniref:DUF6924 domain-containing protein n=1 Tax=Rhodococcus spelaei TaxID=2546320 RepID=A0A541BSE6_9NOCA|nr:hypothetical protein FK531_02835 [Rhodococcus spelaei]